MKTVSFLLISYVVLFFVLRLFLFPSTDGVSDQEPVQKSIAELQNRSSKYHGKRVICSGTVQSTGHELLDLFFVKSFVLCDQTACVRVFTQNSVPEKGASVKVIGYLFQYHASDSKGLFVGINEKKRGYYE